MKGYPKKYEESVVFGCRKMVKGKSKIHNLLKRNEIELK